MIRHFCNRCGIEINDETRCLSNDPESISHEFRPIFPAAKSVPEISLLLMLGDSVPEIAEDVPRFDLCLWCVLGLLNGLDTRPKVLEMRP